MHVLLWSLDNPQFACKQMQKFFFPFKLFLFLVQPVPLDRFPFYLCLSFSNKIGQARTKQVKRGSMVSEVGKSSWLDLSYAPITGRESPPVQPGD